MRNFEKLLKLGLGSHCISFTSCHHKFDYACIKKIQGETNKTLNIKCPLCSSSASFLLPVYPDKIK